MKYVIWAADMDRAVAFYRDLCGGRLLKQNSVIAEVEILGSVIGIHSGGEGKRTWTGLSFQVPDVIVGAREVVAAGGQVVREPEPEDGEPPHLAMCVDPEGNEFRLSRKREESLPLLPGANVPDTVVVHHPTRRVAFEQLNQPPSTMMAAPMKMKAPPITTGSCNCPWNKNTENRATNSG